MFFSATNIERKSDNESWVYSGIEIALDGAGSWNLGNDDARNVVIYAVDKSSSSHADNLNNNFLVLGEGSKYGINGSYDVPEKTSGINFSKARTKFWFGLQ